MPNPYEPPQSAPARAEPGESSSSSVYGWSTTPNCPFCQTPISRFKVWNSLGVKKCPTCEASLWLQAPPALRMIFFPVALLIAPAVVFLLNSRINWIWAIPPAVLAAVFIAQLRWGYIGGVSSNPARTAIAEPAEPKSETEAEAEAENPR